MPIIDPDSTNPGASYGRPKRRHALPFAGLIGKPDPRLESYVDELVRVTHSINSTPLPSPKQLKALVREQARAMQSEGEVDLKRLYEGLEDLKAGIPEQLRAMGLAPMQPKAALVDHSPVQRSYLTTDAVAAKRALTAGLRAMGWELENSFLQKPREEER